MGKVLLMSNYESKFEEALELYKNGMSLSQIGKQLKIDRNRLSRDLKKMGITITQNGQKYNYNMEIFKKIDTEEKAYWLGFLYADGYNNGKDVELTLQESDYNHLVKFRKFIGDESIKILYKKKTKAYRIYIHSKEIAQDLINLGCFQAKSLTLKFPTEEQVPKYLIHHFMRGYFDGDGSITSIIPKKCIKEQFGFSVIGTSEFLNKYEEYLLKGISRDINNRTNRQRRYDWSEETESIQYRGNNQVFKIFQFLYKDATIYLDRKYQKFNMLLPSQDETDK